MEYNWLALFRLGGGLASGQPPGGVVVGAIFVDVVGFPILFLERFCPQLSGAGASFAKGVLAVFAYENFTRALVELIEFFIGVVHGDG